MTAAQILGLYRLTFSALTVAASIQTLLGAHPGHGVPVLPGTDIGHGVPLLAGAEIAGAVMLCWRRTQWLGAGLLLIVFGCAQVLSAMQGEWPTRFLLYAASALLIVTMDRALTGAARQ